MKGGSIWTGSSKRYACLPCAAPNQRLGARYDQHGASGFGRSELSLKFADGHKFLTAACAEAAVF
jgi:hypothetical protein